LSDYIQTVIGTKQNKKQIILIFPSLISLLASTRKTTSVNRVNKKDQSQQLIIKHIL
jgi:hypothetical protein